MEVNVRKIDKLKHKLNIGLTGKEFLEEKNKFYRQAAKKFRVPGFRPGKAPLEVIEKHHKEALKEDFIKGYLPIAYQQAVKENNINPASLPKISEVNMTSDAFTFTAEIEIQPEIDIDQAVYKGIKIKTQSVKPEAKEVEQTIKKFQEEVKNITGTELDRQKLARWASYPDSDSFKEAIETQIHLENIQKRRRNVEEQIRKHLLDSVKLEVPEAEVTNYHRQLVERQLQQLRQQGVNQKDLDKYKEDFEKKLQPIAKDEVKFYYILGAIAKKEKVKEGPQMANAAIGLILSEAQFK